MGARSDRERLGIESRCWKTGKHAYTKRNYAKQHAKEILSQRGVKLITYQCKECGCWHVSRPLRWKNDLPQTGDQG